MKTDTPIVQGYKKLGEGTPSPDMPFQKARLQMQYAGIHHNHGTVPYTGKSSNEEIHL